MHFNNFRFCFWIFLANWDNNNNRFGFGFRRLVSAAATADDVFCEHFCNTASLLNWFSY